MTRRMWRAALPALLLIGLTGCGVLRIGRRPPPAPPEPMAKVFEEVCRRVWREELLRPAGAEFDSDDMDSLRTCIARQASGVVTEAQLRDEVRQSDEWEAKHQPPPPPLPPLAPAMPRLRVEGRYMTVDGQPFVWRFASAFSLVSLVAHDREADARAFLQWAKATGFSGLRVFTMLPWADLTPDRGLAALSRTLALAAEDGLYLEVVALADTAVFGLTAEVIRRHVSHVGAIVDQHSNAMVELANENRHDKNLPILSDAQFLRELRALIQSSVPVAFGSNCCGQSDKEHGPDGGGYPNELRGGDYLTVHTDRSRDTWNRTRHMRALEALSAQAHTFVVADEPIGAGESGGGRSANEHEFFGQGAMSRLMNTGATFHFSDGLHAVVPQGLQRAAAEAFIAGTRIIPDDVQPLFRNAGWTGPLESPVTTADGALRVFAGVYDDGAHAVVLIIDPSPSFTLQLRDGWRVVGLTADRPGVRVVEIER